MSDHNINLFYYQFFVFNFSLMMDTTVLRWWGCLHLICNSSWCLRWVRTKIYNVLGILKWPVMRCSLMENIVERGLRWVQFSSIKPPMSFYWLLSCHRPSSLERLSQTTSFPKEQRRPRRDLSYSFTTIEITTTRSSEGLAELNRRDFNNRLSTHWNRFDKFTQQNRLFSDAQHTPIWS